MARKRWTKSCAHCSRRCGADQLVGWIAEDTSHPWRGIPYVTDGNENHSLPGQPSESSCPAKMAVRSVPPQRREERRESRMEKLCALQASAVSCIVPPACDSVSRCAMSDFKFHCPHCRQRLQCDEQLAGRRIVCPSCRRQVVIPQGPKPRHPPVPGTAGSRGSKSPPAPEA